LVSLAVAPLYGQFLFGVKAGGTFARLQQEAEGGYSWSSSYHTGLALNIYLANFSFGGFAVQAEALYNRKGREGLHLNYVEAPLGLIYLLNLGRVIPYISVTPYYAFLLNVEAAEQDDVKTFAKSDYGVKLGGGVELRRFQISASRVWGIRNIAKDGNAVAHNLSTEISMGYFFLR
jgi:hypothetical protein